MEKFSRGKTATVISEAAMHGMRLFGFVLLAVVTAAQAKLPAIELHELVARSTTLVRGRVASCKSSGHIERCRIDSLKVYKGDAALRSLDVCKDITFTESPRLSVILGHEVILFLGASHGCYAFSDGYRSLTRLEAGMAYPGVVANLPQEMTLSEFEKALSAAQE